MNMASKIALPGLVALALFGCAAIEESMKNGAEFGAAALKYDQEIKLPANAPKWTYVQEAGSMSEGLMHVASLKSATPFELRSPAGKYQMELRVKRTTDGRTVEIVTTPGYIERRKITVRFDKSQTFDVNLVPLPGEHTRYTIAESRNKYATDEFITALKTHKLLEVEAAYSFGAMQTVSFAIDGLKRF